MRLEKKTALLSIILILSIIASLMLLSGCILNYSKVFSTYPLPVEDNESNNDDAISDEIDSGGFYETNQDEQLKEGNCLEMDNNLGINDNDYIEDKANPSPCKLDHSKDEDDNTAIIPSNPEITNLDNVPGETEDNVPGETEDNEKLERETAIPAAKIIRNSTDNESKRVAITFDDGPDKHFTPQILDILKEYDTKATFFVLGSNAKKHQNVLKRIDEEGHVVANHSWSHKNFTKISRNTIIKELHRTDELIQEVIGKSYSLFRLPYGAFNQRALKTVAEQGFHNIYWSIDPRDWSGNSPKKILDNIRANIEPGAIILLHSFGSAKSIPNTIKALPQIIEFLQEQGYEMVTIPDLLEDILFQ